MNKPVLILIILLLIGTGLILVNKFSKTDRQAGIEKKTPHFVDSSPSNREVFAANPVNVVINFDFDLAGSSTISIQKDGQEIGVGMTQISDNKLTMRRELKPDLNDGVYHVNYKACWPDQSCHEGYFTFQMDSNQKSSYQNLTNQKEVTIRMTDLKFEKPKILISPNTKVTWINTENTSHYVNTDPHPSHTYFSAQNSLEIVPNAQFSVTFTQPGEYPYHCSAHVPDNMFGRIIVQ